MVVQGHCKPEEKMGMYPSEWWWAERQVNEILAEHPGELVKTGEGRGLYLLQDPPTSSALHCPVTGGPTRPCPWPLRCEASLWLMSAGR